MVEEWQYRSDLRRIGTGKFLEQKASDILGLMTVEAILESEVSPPRECQIEMASHS